MTLTKSILSLSALLLALGLAREVSAQDKLAVNGGIETRVTDQYANLRGFVPSPTPSVQPIAYIQFGKDGYKLNSWFWGSYEIDPGFKKETDFGVSVSKNLTDDFKGTFAWVRYDIKRDDLNLEEVSLILDYSIHKEGDNSLNARLECTVDYTEDGDGVVVEGGFNTSISDFHVSMVLLGNNQYFIEGTEIAGIRIRADYSIKLTENLSLVSDIHHFEAIGKSFKSNNSLGFSVSYSF
ncbi:hypothetical protein CEE44_00695 [Candidatus Woesearchaeota archaeon B3_Woes]|nr:MAG: hypothetical protein CEE44_00695 [Candidatus Woesearchaeota archaeon B3_Woes]